MSADNRTSTMDPSPPAAAAAPASLPLPPLPSPAATAIATPASADSAAAAATAAAAAAAASAAAAAAAYFSTPARRLLYSLMVRQLRDDGLESVAQSLACSPAVLADPSALAAFPPQQLSHLVGSALAHLQSDERIQRRSMKLARPDQANDASERKQAEEDDSDDKEDTMDTSSSAAAVAASSSPFSLLGASPSLLDLTTRPLGSASASSSSFPPYSLRFQSSHNDAVTAAAFSADGALFASGARDGMIRLYDTARARASAATARGGVAREEESSSSSGGRLRSKSEHTGPRAQLHRWSDFESSIAEMAFHPFEPFLLGTSRDATLKFFGYEKVLERAAAAAAEANPDADRDRAGEASSRKASKLLAVESAPVTAVSFHPCGDVVLVATEANFARIYDVRTFSAFCSPDFGSFHSSAVLCARFEPTRGGSYATASADGSVKIWDGSNGACVRTIMGAHSGAPVTSVEYSPSGGYLLTTGMDSTSRLWDLASGKLVHTYFGAAHRTQIKAAFEQSGEFVLCGDEATPTVAVWVSTRLVQTHSSRQSRKCTAASSFSFFRVRACSFLFSRFVFLFSLSVLLFAQDTRTSELVRRVDTHTSVVRSIAVSPVDQTFITCSDDNKVKLWSVL